MLAAAGALNRKMIIGLVWTPYDAAAAFELVKMPRQPPPASSIAFSGYFGEVIQSDVVYLCGSSMARTSRCWAFHVRQPRIIQPLLESRAPSDVLRTLQEIWYLPFGLPLKFRCDPGGEFGGEVIHATCDTASSTTSSLWRRTVAWGRSSDAMHCRGRLPRDWWTNAALLTRKLWTSA